jgi:hypothetical protein
MREIKAWMIEDCLWVSGKRVVVVPLAESINAYIPTDVISMDVLGSIDILGNITITSKIPEAYNKYLFAKEKIKINPKGDIMVDLKYSIVEATASASDSVMDYIKNSTYNAMAASVKSHILGLYSAKREAVFGQVSHMKVANVDELFRVFSL